MQAITSKSAARMEWPTLALLALDYAVLAALVWFHFALAWWIILPIGAYFGCLNGSLQHEVLHGHPTRSRRLNEALVFISPQLWLPYGRYRDLHLAHHNDLNLTCPVRDPESYYLLPDHWQAMSGLRKALHNFNNTLMGRMLVGPAISIIQFWGHEFSALLKGRTEGRKCWLAFGVSTLLVISFVVWCTMPVWQYILLIAYPSISLSLVRSFCEHQAAEDVGHRTILVEASAFWALLFLNNNLHIAHHERPKIAWYKLPAYYAEEKARLVERNGNFLKLGYGEIFRSYFWRSKEPVVHPNMNWLRRR
jgi:fatty acid desaturase